MRPRIIDVWGHSELVLAEWPDGFVVTRSIMRPHALDPDTRYHTTVLIVRHTTDKMMDSSYLPWSEVGTENFQGPGEHIGKWRWFILGTIPEGPLREKLLRPFRIEDPVPGELMDDIEMYSLLNEVHPVFHAWTSFGEWISGVFG